MTISVNIEKHSKHFFSGFWYKNCDQMWPGLSLEAASCNGFDFIIIISLKSKMPHFLSRSNLTSVAEMLPPPVDTTFVVTEV